MKDRLTLEQKLIKAKKPVPEKVTCPACYRSCWPFEIVDVNDTPSIPHDDVCSHCFIDTARALAVKAEAEAKKEVQGWDSDEGAAIKADRNRRLEACMWATQAGTPLTQKCQEEFCEYRKKLHRLTVDFNTPGDVIWPDQPTLVYQ